MTRRVAGSSQTTQTRPPYVLPIGHLSTKSSVYSPVSMSRMSQDLVYNHMKSHYQRISSAKACVDTSAPKSMKLTIKEKDRKRKEALLALNASRATSQSLPRQSNYPTEASNSNDRPRSSPGQSQRLSSVKSTRNLNETFQNRSNLKQTQSNGRLKELSNQTSDNQDESLRENSHSLENNTHINKRNYESFDRHKTDRKGNFENDPTVQSNDNAKGSESNSVNNFRGNDNSVGNANHIDEYSYEGYERTTPRGKDRESGIENYSGRFNNENIRSSEITDESNFNRSFQQEKWEDLINASLQNDFEKYRTTDRLQTSTPRVERENEYSTLNLSTMTFSYKSPPIRRKPRKPRRKKPEELIWNEEQKYLQFISDVTSDVLARGICSNRVITKVFESHIEKRKDELDEEKMREMIDQLKEDLGVTDD